MVKLQNKLGIGYATGLLLTNILLLCILAFQYFSENITNQDFFIAYVTLGVVSTVVSFIAWAVTIANSVTSQEERVVAGALSLSQSDPKTRWFSIPGGKLISAGVLCVLVFFMVSIAGSLVPVGNPYAAGPLTSAALSEHNLITNVFNTAVYPGFYEEMPIFFIVNIVMLGLLLLMGRWRQHPLGFLTAAMVGVSAGATVFTLAHTAAYGMDAQAFTVAFIFEWVMQAANVLTGGFISWAPHALHNALVVYKTQASLAIGGLLAVSPAVLWWRWRT